MPITPLHLGPGLLFKAGARRRMSLTVFAFSQVMMDVEVLVRVALGAPRLHGFSNTMLGATLLLLPSALLGRWMCQGFLRWWNQQLSRRQARWLAVDAAIGRPAAWLGACLGVYSHLFLDALMHLDAEPWAPFSSANPFLGIVSVTQLNVLCAWSLLAGVAWLVIARFWPRDAI